MSQVESFFHWKTPAGLSNIAIHPHIQFPRHHIHFQAYVLPEHSGCMVAENGLGAELVSGCGVVSAWTEDLHAYFVWVLNMLDCIILVFMVFG